MGHEGYKVYSATYESATGTFNATEVNPFTSSVNGSCQSYLVEQVLSKINSMVTLIKSLFRKNSLILETLNYLWVSFSLENKKNIREHLKNTPLIQLQFLEITIITKIKKHVVFMILSCHICKLSMNKTCADNLTTK